MCVDLQITDDELGEFSEVLTLFLSSGPSVPVTIIDDGGTALSLSLLSPATLLLLILLLFLQIQWC